jgi:hypothetical protein
MQRYGNVMCMCQRMPDALADALGNMVYIVKLKEKKEIDSFFKYLTE